jgi:RNA polymerase sigma factor for flagellar operon FliA
VIPIAIATRQAGRPSSAETLALWRAYEATGDIVARARLVLTFAPMVKYIAYKKVRELPPRSDVEDFVSCGLEALIRSLDRYDPDKGASLEQYLWTRIHGAVIDEMRRHDWAPRSLRRWERDINRAADSFTGLHGRRPTATELADSLGIDVAELSGRLSDIAASDVSSLNAMVLGDDEMMIERIDTLPSRDPGTDPERKALRRHSVDRVRSAFESLPERDRQVAVMLYVHEMTMREAGAVLGVSESRVSQINAQLRPRLCAQLAGHAELLVGAA